MTPPKSQTPEALLAELAAEGRRQRRRADELDASSVHTAPLSAQEEAELEERVLARLGLESAGAGPLKRGVTVHPSVRSWTRLVAPLALAAGLVFLVLVERDPPVVLPSFELQTPSSDAVFRSPPPPGADRGPEQSAVEGVRHYSLGRQLRFVLRPSTRTHAAVRTRVFARRLAKNEPSSGSWVPLEVSVAAQDGGAQQVTLVASAPPLAPGNWQLLFLLGPAGGEELAENAGPEQRALSDWQRLAVDFTLHSAPVTPPEVTP
jgi:hypothetical protein